MHGFRGIGDICLMIFVSFCGWYWLTRANLSLAHSPSLNKVEAIPTIDWPARAYYNYSAILSAAVLGDVKSTIIC